MTALSMHQASVPVFVRALTALSTELDKAAAFAAERKFDPTILVTSRLFPDMLSLAGQVQRASDTSKLSGARLSGAEAPKFEDVEATLPELQERIAKTIAYLESLDPVLFVGSEDKTITLNSIGEFKGDVYLLSFALPNFFFHIATAHALLRHNGVPVGKRDFLGPVA